MPIGSRRLPARWALLACFAAGLLWGACQQGAEEAPRTFRANIEPLGQMAAKGSASLTATDSTVTVRLEVRAVVPDTAHPQHIHRGRCDQIGPVLLPLETGEGRYPRADSTGTLTYERTFPSVPDSLGARILLVHGPGGTPVACGPIQPAEAGP